MICDTCYGEGCPLCLPLRCDVCDSPTATCDLCGARMCYCDLLTHATDSCTKKPPGSRGKE